MSKSIEWGLLAVLAITLAAIAFPLVRARRRRLPTPRNGDRTPSVGPTMADGGEPRILLQGGEAHSDRDQPSQIFPNPED